MKLISAKKYKTNKGYYDFPIGTKFIYLKDMVKLEVEAPLTRFCDDCYFIDKSCSLSKSICNHLDREDKQDVIFKKIW